MKGYCLVEELGHFLRGPYQSIIHSEMELKGIDRYMITYVNNDSPDGKGLGTYGKGGSVCIYSEDVVWDGTTG